MAAENTKREDVLSDARQEACRDARRGPAKGIDGRPLNGDWHPSESARSRREGVTDLLARVRHELERRADAGASLSELDDLLIPHRRNPRLSVDQYDALWLYAWALLHRPGRTWRGPNGSWYDAVEPG
jgi:hypothetical protein